MRRICFLKRHRFDRLYQLLMYVLITFFMMGNSVNNLSFIWSIRHFISRHFNSLTLKLSLNPNPRRFVTQLTRASHAQNMLALVHEEFCLGVIHEGRPHYRGRGVYQMRTLLLIFACKRPKSADTGGRGGHKTVKFCGRPLWMAPYAIKSYVG